MIDKIVIMESIRNDLPFQLAEYVKETDKTIMYRRLVPKDNLEETNQVRRKNVIGVVDYSELDKLKEIQDDFRKRWWNVEEDRKVILSDIKKQYNL